MTIETALSEMTDQELLDHTESAICASSFWAGRGGDHEKEHRACDEAYTECHRRTPSGHLYQIAWNRAARGVCGPMPVPPDTRRAVEAAG